MLHPRATSSLLEGRDRLPGARQDDDREHDRGQQRTSERRNRDAENSSGSGSASTTAGSRYSTVKLGRALIRTGLAVRAPPCSSDLQSAARRRKGCGLAQLVLEPRPHRRRPHRARSRRRPVTAIGYRPARARPHWSQAADHQGEIVHDGLRKVPGQRLPEASAARRWQPMHRGAVRRRSRRVDRPSAPRHHDEIGADGLS